MVPCVCSVVLGPDGHPRVILSGYSKREQERGSLGEEEEVHRGGCWSKACMRRTRFLLELSCRTGASSVAFSLILKEVIPNRGLHLEFRDPDGL